MSLNAATLNLRLEDPCPFTVADGTGIEKGTILTLTDPLTASETLAVQPKIAGIAAREKVANDGRTQLGVYRKGWFVVTASGNILVGDPVAVYNQVVVVPGITASGCNILGVALEAIADGTTGLVELNIQGSGAVS